MGRASRAREQARVRPGQARLDGATRDRRLAAVETRAVLAARDAAAVLSMLRRLPERRAALAARQRELVDQARALEVGWPVIAAALQVTPQAVQQRYGSASSAWSSSTS